MNIYTYIYAFFKKCFVYISNESIKKKGFGKLSFLFHEYYLNQYSLENSAQES